MLDLYRNIKNRRIELGITQTELAQRTGYADKSMIAKIEKGLIDLPQSKIIAFADALNTTPGHLMGWDEPSVYNNDDTVELAKAIKDNDELHALFSAVRNADPEDLEAIHNMYLTLKRKER